MSNNNTGYNNTGHYNTGHNNTGHNNTGCYNTGDCNTGDHNTGDHNTGHYNIGSHNIGRHNTGRYNIGHYNIGSYNTGCYNTGCYNTGDCNTTEPTVRLFNKDSGLKFLGETHLKFINIVNRLSSPLCEWVSERKMSDKEKADYSTYKTTGGYLKVNEERRNKLEATKEEKDFLKSLPNFDAVILKECTGIDLDSDKVKIIIDGKEIWISRESAMALKEQL